MYTCTLPINLSSSFAGACSTFGYNNSFTHDIAAISKTEIKLRILRNGNENEELPEGAGYCWFIICK